jgi:hypothetical protein
VLLLARPPAEETGEEAYMFGYAAPAWRLHSNTLAS